MAAGRRLVACGRGSPLTVGLTGGNRNDITQMLPLVDAIPPVRGKRGRPRRRPKRLYGDRAYHSREGRRELRRRGIQPQIAAPKTPHGSGLGKQRWVVERTIAWPHQYRRLRVRYETPRRHPRSVPLDRLQPDLPQAPPRRITASEPTTGSAKPSRRTSSSHCQATAASWFTVPHAQPSIWTTRTSVTPNGWPGHDSGCQRKRPGTPPPPPTTTQAHAPTSVTRSLFRAGSPRPRATPRAPTCSGSRLRRTRSLRARCSIARSPRSFRGRRRRPRKAILSLLGFSDGQDFRDRLGSRESRAPETAAVGSGVQDRLRPRAAPLRSSVR